MLPITISMQIGCHVRIYYQQYPEESAEREKRTQIKINGIFWTSELESCS